MNFTCQNLLNLFHMRFFTIKTIRFHGLIFSWRLKHDASGNIAKWVTHKLFALTKCDWVKLLYACCYNFSCEISFLLDFDPYWCRTIHWLHHQKYPCLWRIKDVYSLISIKMFQIPQRIFSEYPLNFRGLPNYGFAHAKVKK